MFAWIFGTVWPKMAVLGQDRGRGSAMLTTTNTFVLLGLLPLCYSRRKSIKKCENADRQRQRQTIAMG